MKKISKTSRAVLTLVLVLLSMFMLSTIVSADENTQPFGVIWNDVPVYSGAELKPTPVVTYMNQKLIADVDYTLTYSNNINAGTAAEVRIVGQGDYTGLSMTAYFAISPVEISTVATFTVEAVGYTGGPVEPKGISVIDKNGNQLVRDTDYKVIFLNNVATGTATARFIGIGNYTGYYDTTYEIFDVERPSTEQLVIDFAKPNDLDGKSFVTAGETRVQFKKNKTNPGTALYINGKNLSQYALLDFQAYLAPGENVVKYHYKVTVSEVRWEMVNGVMKKVVYTNTYTEIITFTIISICNEPFSPTELTIQEPIFQGADTVYLEVIGECDEGIADVGVPVWSSSDTEIASVRDGILTIHKPGNAIITATVGDLIATWNLEDIAALTLSKNTSILNFDPNTEKATVLWKNQLLTEGKDYTISVNPVGEKTVVTILGINSFCDFISGEYYTITGYPFQGCIVQHTYSYDCDSTCDICNKMRPINHTYSDNADSTCDVCGQERVVLEQDDSEIIASGSCGADVAWSLTELGTLTISGTGPMSNYSAYYYTPWYYYKTDIKNINITDGVTSIGDFAFYMSSVEKVSISSTVTKLGDSCFRDCDNLKDVILPEGAKEIGEMAFYGSSRLQTVVIPSSVQKIGESCFELCIMLRYCIIPSGVTEIPREMFAGCSMLEHIQIPESVTKINTSALSLSPFGNNGREYNVYFTGSEAQFDAINGSNEVRTHSYLSIHYNAKAPCLSHAYGAFTSAGADYHEHTCFNCGEKETFDHTWDDGTIVKEASCVEEGIKTYTCTECGEIKTENSPAMGHNMQQTAVEVAPTCETAGKTTVFACATCGMTQGGEEVPALGHNMQETVAAVAPTCEMAGKTAILTCGFGCGKVEGGEEIPAKGHSFENDTCTVCGQGKFVVGDANGDGKVNLRDAILVLQASNGKDVAVDRGAADVTGDGKMNIRDAILILKRANGNKDPFPAEK